MALTYQLNNLTVRADGNYLVFKNDHAGSWGYNDLSETPRLIARQGFPTKRAALSLLAHEIGEERFNQICWHCENVYMANEFPLQINGGKHWTMTIRQRFWPDSLYQGLKTLEGVEFLTLQTLKAVVDETVAYFRAQS